MLNRIWRASQRVGFIPTILGVIAWLMLGVMVPRLAAAVLWPYPVVARIVGLGAVVIVGLGGLVCFWLLADHIEYLRHGYRVRWVSGNDWLYEERNPHEERTLACTRMILGGGYPAPSEIRIPSEAAWEVKAPRWAAGRRDEIRQRIADAFGADRGGQIRFADQ